MPSLPAARDSELPSEIRPVTRGELIVGRYRLLATLGRGGMADVYLGAAAGPAGFNKLVVIKKLRNGTEDAGLVEMFLDEARLAARLNHPNIIHTYEVDESPEGYLLVMEYLEGQSLRSLAKALRAADGRFDPVLAAHLVSEVLEGLHYVHEMRDYDGSPLGIVHRDVSPQNIFVTYDGAVKVLDFGIAKGALNVTDTQSGVLKGKVSFMAPEQVSAGPVDRRADIFSAGVVLWELLTGEKLFKGDVMETLRSVMSSPIQPPSSLARGVPPELDRIVMKALSRDVDGRFDTALAMNKALADLVRRSGRVIRREDVAGRMQEFFGEARETMARTVQTYMASRSSDTGAPSDLLLPASLRPAPSDPMGPSSGVRPMTPVVPLPRPFRPWRVAAGVVALALFAGGGFFLSRSPLLTKFAHARMTSTEEVGQRARDGKTVQDGRREAEPICHMTLSSDPLEAQVEWGGVVIGQTPMLIDLLPGPQKFVLSRDGYFKATVVLNIVDSMAGKAESRTVVMIPRKGKSAGALAAARANANLKSALANVVASEATESPPYAVAPSDIDPVVGSEAPSASPPLAKSMPTAALSTADDLPVAVAAPVITPPAAPAAPAAPTVLAAPAVPAVLPFGPEMTRPTLVSGGELSYPREAMVAGIAGNIIAKCTVTAEGLLRNCRIIKGLPFLDKAALDVLATRRYSPVMFQGKAVSVEYVFNLKVTPPSSR